MPHPDGEENVPVYQLRTVGLDEEQDEVTEELVAKGPQMFMDVDEERQAREQALMEAVAEAERSGLPSECAPRLRDMVLYIHAEAFRRALVGEPPAAVPEMQVKLKPGSLAIQAKPRVYPPAKTQWLAAPRIN